MKNKLITFTVILVIILIGVFLLINLFQKGKELLSNAPKISIPSLGINLPTKDVKGEDLLDVPRYQPSARVSYNKDSNDGTVFVDIIYYTKDSFNNVYDFYIKKMPQNNWKLIKEESSPGVTLLNLEITDSRMLDFRKQNCIDPSECLPYAKITIGGFKIGDNEYTGIIVNYENRSESQTSDSDKSVSEDNQPPTEVSPTSEAGKAFHQLLQPILSKITGEAVLTSFNETNVFGQNIIEVEYTLSSPVENVSEAVSIIREGFVNAGIPSSAISSTVNADEGTVQVLSQQSFAGKSINVISVTVRRNSKIIEAGAYSSGL